MEICHYFMFDCIKDSLKFKKCIIFENMELRIFHKMVENVKFPKSSHFTNVHPIHVFCLTNDTTVNISEQRTVVIGGLPTKFLRGLDKVLLNVVLGYLASFNRSQPVNLTIGYLHEVVCPQSRGIAGHPTAHAWRSCRPCQTTQRP